MIRAEAKNFNDRSVSFVKDVLTTAHKMAPRSKQSSLRLLSFISDLAGRWTEQEIINQNNDELENIFRNLIENHRSKNNYIPNLILSTNEIRVEEFIEGKTLNQSLLNAQDPETKRKLLEQLLSFLNFQLDQMTILHPDPHAGNFLIPSDSADQLSILDINRLIHLSEQERIAFKALARNDSKEFLKQFLLIFGANCNLTNFNFSTNRIKSLQKIIASKILKNRIIGFFKRKNPFIEWQVLIETLIESGLDANDFRVEWQLIFRMIALRDSIQIEIQELDNLKS